MGWLMGGDGFREMIEGEGRKKGRREGVEKEMLRERWKENIITNTINILLI